MPFMFGVNEFSYVRVYFNAAAIYSYALFLFISMVAMRYLDSKHNLMEAVLILVLGMLVLLITHPQELMFLAVMVGLVAIVVSLQLRKQTNSVLMWAKSRSTIIAGLTVVISLCLILYVLVNPTTKTPSGPRVFNLQDILPFIQGVYIISVDELHRIIGISGIVVMTVSAFYWREWYRSPWLVASFLSLFVTVFNPFFVDIFWHFSPTSDSMYRFLFLSQSYWFMAILLWTVWKEALKPSVNLRRIAPIAVVIVIFISTLFGYKALGPNRLDGLISVPKEQSSRHWEDLWKYMDTLPEFPTVITDPLTGYMVRGFTRQHFNGHKFRANSEYKKINFNDYSNFPLNQYVGAYFIENLRDGDVSKMGETTKHWSKDELKISRYYSPKLIDHLHSHPDIFKQIWKSEDGKIFIYKIHPY
jgi:hypothetical protein